MKTIEKINDKTISINGAYASADYVAHAIGNEVMIAERGADLKCRAYIHFDQLEVIIDGEARLFESANEAVTVLNSFIGNFKTGEGTPSPTSPDFPLTDTNDVIRVNTEPGQPVNVTGGLVGSRNDYSVDLAYSALFRAITKSAYGGWVEVDIQNDASGAGGGFRWKHNGNVQCQMMTGSPDYPFHNGLNFDLTNGQEIQFTIRRADGRVKFSTDPYAKTGAADCSIVPYTKSVIAGDLTKVNGVHMQGGTKALLQAQGKDSDIDLNLVPKGTGIINANGSRMGGLKEGVDKGDAVTVAQLEALSTRIGKLETELAALRNG